MRERPLKRSDFDELVAAYGKKHRQHERVESERFHRFAYDELAKREKLNLDVFWFKDASATDSQPAPDEVTAEIVASLELALEKFRSVAVKLAPGA